MIADAFHLDPVDVLNSDWFDWQLRLVCFEEVQEEKERQAEEQKKKARRSK